MGRYNPLKTLSASLWPRFKEISVKGDKVILNAIKNNIVGYQRVSFNAKHTLYTIAADCKRVVRASPYQALCLREVDTVLIKKKMEYLPFLLNLAKDDLDTNQAMGVETLIRLSLSQIYFTNIRALVDHDELKIEPELLCRLLDCQLLGTSSERFLGRNFPLFFNFIVLNLFFMVDTEHMLLFSPTCRPSQLQHCIYHLLNSEVDSISNFVIAMNILHADHLKYSKRLTGEFLFDVVEVNTKARCIFAWSST